MSNVSFESHVEILRKCGADENTIAAYIRSVEEAEKYARVLTILKKKFHDGIVPTNSTAEEYDEKFSSLAALMVDTIKPAGTSGLIRIKLPTQFGSMQVVVDPNETGGEEPEYN